jgi:hypothetical protein
LGPRGIGGSRNLDQSTKHLQRRVSPCNKNINMEIP